MKDLSAPASLDALNGDLRRGVFLLALAVLGSLAVGCTPSPREAVEMPADPPYIRGMLTRSDSATILVEENPSDSVSLKVVLRFGPDARILWRTGEPASRGDLRLGTHVSAWVDGPVLQSFPSRATLGTLVIESTTEPGSPGV